MKTFRLFLISLLSICCLSSCEEDDDYVYPSVQLEFLTGRAGVNGSLATLTRDNGQLLEVAEDASATTASPGDTLRLVANYETKEVSQNGVPRVKIYALLQAISPKPEPASAFKNGVFTDPVAIQSVWKGNAYLNAVLLVKRKAQRCATAPALVTTTGASTSLYVAVAGVPSAVSCHVTPSQLC